MPNESRPDRIHPGSFSTQHVPVTPDFLPAPAVKLVVTQYLKTSVESPFWAWIIVGAFYDANNRIIWSARLFACQLDVDSEASSSDSESGTSSSSSSLSGESERSSTQPQVESTPSTAQNLSALDSFSDDLRDSFLQYIDYQRQARVTQRNPTIVTHSVPDILPTRAEPRQPRLAPIDSSTNWYIGETGPVYGQWMSIYDPALRRWVNRWQQLS